jgi:hypothetical protein
VRRLLLLVVVVALLPVGCSADEETTPAEETVKVYFLRDGKVWPASRALGETGTLGAALEAGPTEQEQAELGLSSEASGPRSRVGDAQWVYTLTQFPGTAAVVLHGIERRRADYEDLTPAVLVESPLPFQEVTSPLRVTGTANTFEATFQYELLDDNGDVVDEGFVTATSGTGTRGTFDFTTGDFDDVAKLRVFERSAKDGSRINLVEIPVRMTR